MTKKQLKQRIAELEAELEAFRSGELVTGRVAEDLSRRLCEARRPESMRVMGLVCPGCGFGDDVQPHICGISNTGINPLLGQTVNTSGTRGIWQQAPREIEKYMQNWDAS